MWQIKLAEFLRRTFTGSDKKKVSHLFQRIDRLETDLRDRFFNGFQRDMSEVQRAQGQKLLLGSARNHQGEPFEVWITLKDFLEGNHSWIMGGTGAGKTFFILNLILQFLAQKHTPMIIFDCKGELIDLLVHNFIPWLLSDMHEEERSWFLNRIVHINPFHQRFLPAFHILKPDRTVPLELQVHNTVGAFQQNSQDELGVRQNNILYFTLRLATEQNLSFLQAKEILENPHFRQCLVNRSTSREVRNYFNLRFKDEHASSLVSLLSRFDCFLRLPSTRLMLSARETIDFAELLDKKKIILINVGNPPLGCKDISAFFSKFIFYRLTQAFLSRQVNPDTPSVPCVIDEWQETLREDAQAEEMGRILSLARHKKVSLILLNQQIAQISKVSSSLVEIINTNSNYQFFFRSSFKDAQHFSHALPVTGRRIREKKNRWDDSEKQQFLSPSEELRLLQGQVAQLPDRQMFFYEKRKPYKAQKIGSIELNIGKARRASENAPQELLEAIERGILSVPISELKREQKEREQEIKDIQREMTQEGSISNLTENDEDREDTADPFPLASAEASDGPSPIIPFPGSKKRRGPKGKNQFPELG